jgi:hypothetical protein
MSGARYGVFTPSVIFVKAGVFCAVFWSMSRRGMLSNGVEMAFQPGLSTPFRRADAAKIRLDCSLVRSTAQGLDESWCHWEKRMNLPQCD